MVSTQKGSLLRQSSSVQASEFQGVRRPPSSAITTSTGNNEVLKTCIQLHVDTPDTPNWYLKHHQGLEYLNMAMAQVTDNPAIAEGSSIHQEAKQQLHSYLRTNIQPFMQTGKQASWDDLLLQINRRKPKLVQQTET